MAKREKPNQIPKKFRKLDKPFLKTLEKGNSNTFQAFPKGVTFHGREKDEDIVLVVRSHWIIYAPFLLAALVVMSLPLVFEMMLSTFTESTVLFLALFFSCLTISLTIGIYAFVRWFYNVNIITDKRIIDLDFTSIVSHSLAEARISKIEDVTHKQTGVVGSVFDIGTVYFQTAGATPEIEFDNIPRPRDVQKIVYQLLESKRKGEI
jgi:membrane protein YdbS with pleckstrin-like domain